MPNYNVAPPAVRSPLEQYGKMLQLRALSGQVQQQQQMQPLQVQEAQQDVQSKTLENQKQQMALDSQQALIKAVGSGFLTKYAGKDAGNDAGFDANGAFNDLVKPVAQGGYGVLPDQASAVVDSLLKRSQTMAETAKTIAQGGEAVANSRAKGFDMLHDRVADVVQNPKSAAPLLYDIVHNPQIFAGVPPDDLQHVRDALVAQDADKLKAVGGALDVDKKLADFHKSQTEETIAQQKVIPAGGGMSPDTQQQVKKDVAVATNPAIQAGKVQVETEKAKAEQLIKGLAEPGYAFNPQTGATQLTDKTAYLQAGGTLQGFRPVGEKDIREDTMLTNRLADVHQKIAEYDQALQKPVSAKDQGNMAALLGTEGVKLGAFGTEIPMDRVNAALNKENLKGLSPEARDQLIAYKNAREAMLGYKTVLSGSARGSDKSMDLLTQALPDPSTTDPDFSRRSIDAFHQNLRVVGQGLPDLPGIKSPREIEAEVWGNKGTEKKTPTGPTATNSKAAKYGVPIP